MVMGRTLKHNAAAGEEHRAMALPGRAWARDPHQLLSMIKDIIRE